MWIGDEVPHTQDALSVIRRLAKECRVLKLMPGLGPFDYEIMSPRTRRQNKGSKKS
jgi:hypothetical protein